MNLYKSFLIKICDIEDVSVKDIMEITGKSQSVVYSWLNLSKPECFPSIESLGKLLCRLGMSFDDFINCKHPVYDNGDFARSYSHYTYGSIFQRIIGEDVLNLPNADAVIDTYLHDRMCFNRMVDDYVNGIEIDEQRFNCLCKVLMPTVVSEATDDIGDGEIYELNANSLKRYKLGVDIVNEHIADCAENDVPPETIEHEICFPDASVLILFAAEKNLRFLREYLSIINENDKRYLLERYMEICSKNPKFDKKRKIIKQLIENKCVFIGEENNKTTEKYRKLLEIVLGI